MNTLDLELLRSLMAIDGQGSFAAAAVHLGKTQSAITQQMQRLEEQVGQTLFEKQGRQKRLTDHGERLLGYARHLLAINDEAMRTLTLDHIEGAIRLGAPHDTADTMLPPLLAQIAHSFPMLRMEIHVGRSPFLMERIKKGGLDMVISNRLDDSLEAVVLRTSPTVWLCGAGYTHDRTRPVPLVQADGPSVFRRMAQDALEAAGIEWSPQYVASSLVGIRAALRAGLGVTARGVEQLDVGLRVLGEGDGMPRLPDLVYRLYVRSHVVNPATRKVFEMLENRLRLSGDVLKS